MKIDHKLKMLVPAIGTAKVNRLRQIHLFEDSAQGKSEIENYIDQLIAKHVKTTVDDMVILAPPERKACTGDIHLGTVEYLDRKICPFALKLKDLNRHMGIFGSTGSGKTTTALNIIRQLHKLGLPFMIFDWEKSYRSLVREYDDIEVLTVGKGINPLYMNILDVPPGIDKEEYAKSIIALLAEDYLSGAGSDTIMLNYLEMAYQENANPNFNDLKTIAVREIQKDMKGRGKLAGRSGLWKETVQRILNFLSIGAAGMVLGSGENYPLNKLFKKKVVLEFGNIQSPRDRKFIIHCIVNWLFHWLQYHGIESEQLKQCIIFEEFHNISIQGREDNLISLMFRQVRKYGLGLVAIDQTPSEIPNAIFANMNSKVSFTLATSKDINAMARAMNLDSQHSRFLGMLNTGQAIINVKQRHHDSFVISTPFTSHEGNIWDEELRSRMRQLAGKRRLKRSDFSERSSSQTSQGIETPPPQLQPLEKIILQNIIEKPLDGVDQRSKTLGLHPSQMADIIHSLEQKGYINSAYIDRKKLIKLTDEGKAIAQDAGLKIPVKNHRGGLGHYYWTMKTRQFLKKIEFQPVLEYQDFDIADPVSSIAIEIETGLSNITKNLLKLDKSRFSNRFMLATNKVAEYKIKSRALDFPSITAMHVLDFLKLSASEIQGKSRSHPKIEVASDN
jgi:DNA-binding MarR family transcriptional regulator